MVRRYRDKLRSLPREGNCPRSRRASSPTRWFHGRQRGGSFSMPVRSTLASASLMRTPGDHAGPARSRRAAAARRRARTAAGCGRVSSGVSSVDVVIGEQVDVERARAPALLAARGRGRTAARPPGRGRAAPCGASSVATDDGAIDERRLVGDAPGRGLGSRRSGRRAAPPLPSHSARDGAVERRRARRRHCRRARSAPQPSQRPWRVRRIDTPTSSKVAAIGACGLWMVTRTAVTCGNRSSTASATAPAAASTSR